jgi:hypothetical protein
MDLGLDLAAYKDYVNNLREFAHVHKDLHMFTFDDMNGVKDGLETPNYLLRLEFENADSDPAKEKAIIASITLTIRKLLRKNAGYTTIRDEMAVEAFLKNMGRYFLIDTRLMQLTKRLLKKR